MKMTTFKILKKSLRRIEELVRLKGKEEK